MMKTEQNKHIQKADNEVCFGQAEPDNPAICEEYKKISDKREIRDPDAAQKNP